jgi:integrase
MGDAKRGRGRPRRDHGTTFPHKGTFHFNIGLTTSDGGKRWVMRSSGIPVSDEPAENRRNQRRAEDVRRQAQNALNASAEEFSALGPSVTVAQLMDRFVVERERLGVKTWKSERQRLRDYLAPELGQLRVIDVRPRHLIDAYAHIARKNFRFPKPLGQKTLDETHRTLNMLFKFAAVMDLLPAGSNPCNEVGPRYRRSIAVSDSRAQVRRSYSIFEVATLISHPTIPLYWRCLFGVEALAMTRAGEAGRLRFIDWNPSLENLSLPRGERTLGELFVDGQKTSTPRWVPVHPALAALLSEWKRKGFPDTFGRLPASDDLMFPYVRKAGSRKKQGSSVTTKVIWKELQAWLKALGLLDAKQPTRPQHGLRRAGSAAMADAGVSPHDRRCITHAPDLSNMQERYDAPSWRRLSESVLAIQLPTPLEPKVLPLRRAVGAAQENPTDTGRDPEYLWNICGTATQPYEIAAEKQWRRRESNPRPEAFRPSTLRA